MTTLQYQTGFGNNCATEALPGALPQGRNSPQTCPYGLYAEQLSGTAFTVSRAESRRSWLYRIRPAALQKRSEEHTSELQSLMRISYAVFCLKKNITPQKQTLHTNDNQYTSTRLPYTFNRHNYQI